MKVFYNLFFQNYTQLYYIVLLSTEKFKKVLISTIIQWAKMPLEDPKMVRRMFALLLLQYDGVGELIRALCTTYVFKEEGKGDVTALLGRLSRVRSLLPVQMSQEEEELLRKLLWSVSATCQLVTDQETVFLIITGLWCKIVCSFNILT